MLNLVHGLRRRGVSVFEQLLAPLTGILNLVRAKRFPIADVPTKPVASAVLHYVKTGISDDLDGIGDLAATLSSVMLMKSRELTPWLDPIDLEEILRPKAERNLDLITQLEPSLSLLETRNLTGFETISRNDYVGGWDRIEVTVPLSANVLSRAFQSQMETRRIRDQSKVPPPVFLRVELAIKSLQDCLKRLRGLTFHGLIRQEALDRRATVVYFLAVLDLARNGLIRVEQRNPFDDIRLIPTADNPTALVERAG